MTPWVNALPIQSYYKEQLGFLNPNESFARERIWLAFLGQMTFVN